MLINLDEGFSLIPHPVARPPFPVEQLQTFQAVPGRFGDTS
jgi:hypothetical protein